MGIQAPSLARHVGNAAPSWKRTMLGTFALHAHTPRRQFVLSHAGPVFSKTRGERGPVLEADNVGDFRAACAHSSHTIRAESCRPRLFEDTWGTRPRPGSGQCWGLSRCMRTLLAYNSC